MQLKTFNVYDNKNKAVQDAYDMLTAKIHINNNEKKLKTFALTSCNPKEGKTSLAISLAISVARSGWKVLLVDADMRKPTNEKRLNQESQLGLAEYLSGKIELNEGICQTNIANLTYLSCGMNPNNPVELLCSMRFKQLLEKVPSNYDYVLFDTPALESVADGSIIASNVDAALLVVEAGTTSMKSLKRAKEQLASLGANLTGVVLNKMKRRDYKKYYGSYNYFTKAKNTKRSLLGYLKNFLLPPSDQGIPKNF
ncbi:CpsD/CapB family tyrosine-protein kinase [Dehalobacter sp.]|uniref:tyrosine-protein kinase family protein n=1 Tax=Dehalobacter sp. TaxID=1962289 RepID=UPI0025867A9B|nr:CpsD/CapB family tyrosine-protein kinase [Dehalobacter sp.]MCG1024359.1 CpsD/CapB family tyrosine-protein kinase [Dehalobacter sp.]